MEQNRLILLMAIVGVIIGIALLLYNLFMPPSYLKLLDTIERLMRASDEVRVDYNVNFQSFKNDVLIVDNTSMAYYVLVNDSFEWVNELTNIEGSFYDLPPSELIRYMKLSVTSNVEDYDSNIPCYMLNALIDSGVTKTLLNDFQYLRVMACFNKETGYPDQYTIVGVGFGEGVMVSYNKFGIRVPEVQPNNTMLAEAERLASELNISLV